MISCFGAGHIVSRTSVEGEKKPFPVWEAAFLFVPVRCCARMAVFAVRAQRCAVGGEGAFSGQKRRRGSGIAGFPFVQAIDWPCSPFCLGVFSQERKIRFARMESFLRLQRACGGRAGHLSMVFGYRMVDFFRNISVFRKYSDRIMYFSVH